MKSRKRPPLYLSSSSSLAADIALPSAALAITAALVFFFRTREEDVSRQRRNRELEDREREYWEERARRAHVDAKETWTPEELKQYDGTRDPDGPILLAAAGKVYNVWKGRNFYGPGGEYSMFAGRDATRLLAKFQTTEEDEESLAKPLTKAERATLEGYVWTFRNKYTVVGNLEGFDPKDVELW